MNEELIKGFSKINDDCKYFNMSMGDVMIFYTEFNKRRIFNAFWCYLIKILAGIIISPIIYEVVFMLISVVALANFSRIAFESILIFIWNESKPNITTIIILSFILCLVIYHLSCFILKSVLSKNFARHMDYVYLTSAALGILGASEVAKFQLSHHYLNQIEIRKQEFILANKHIIQAYENSGCYRPETEETSEYNNPASDCEIIAEMIRFFKTSIEIDTSFESLSNNFNSKVTIIKNNPILSRTDLNYIDKLSYNLIRDADTIASPNEYWIPGLDKLVGFLLLATALSLRVTKVTVEIYKWHKQ